MVVNGVFFDDGVPAAESRGTIDVAELCDGTLMGLGLALVTNSMSVLKDMSQIPELSLSSGRSTLETL